MSSRPQITITLGQSGQIYRTTGLLNWVLKLYLRRKRDRFLWLQLAVGRHAAALVSRVVVKRAPESNYDYMPSLDGKRSVRDRLGSNMESSSKRQRTEKSDWNSYGIFGRVDRHDLRFELIKKSLSRGSVPKERNEVDLREKLSRNMQVPSRYDARERVPESRSSGLVRRIPPTRSADDLLHLDSLRKSYSSWTLDGRRHRSPDRFLGASRGITPPRKYDEMRHVSSTRLVDASRPATFMTNGILDASRHTSYLSKPAVRVEAAKTVVRAPPGVMIPKSSYTPEEPVTVSSLLTALGLGKYVILFQAEEVDMSALKQMGDNDLKELGIPMGPRKKILLAVFSRTKQQHR